MARLNVAAKKTIFTTALVQSKAMNSLIAAVQKLEPYKEDIAKVWFFGSVTTYDNHKKAWEDLVQKHKEALLPVPGVRATYPIRNNDNKEEAISDYYDDLCMCTGSMGVDFLKLFDVPSLGELATSERGTMWDPNVLVDSLLGYLRTVNYEITEFTKYVLFTVLRYCNSNSFSLPMYHHASDVTSFYEGVLKIGNTKKRHTLYSEFGDVLVPAYTAYTELQELADSLHFLIKQATTDTRLLEDIPNIGNFVALPLDAPTTALVSTKDTAVVMRSL